MARMVCVKCQKFLHPKKNGVYVEEGMPRTIALCDGSTDEVWVPYKLWHADSWECRTCGVEIVAGFASHPIAEHYQSTYERGKAARPVHVFIKDCL